MQLSHRSSVVKVRTGTDLGSVPSAHSVRRNRQRLHTPKREPAKGLVEPRRFELLTSAVQGRRSPKLSYGPLPELPDTRPSSNSEVHQDRKMLVGHSGLEPETSVLSGLRSNQLS